MSRARPQSGVGGWLRAVATAALVASVAACSGGTSSAPPRATAAPAPPLHEGPLTDFVPAAGLRWMLVGSPQRLLEDASVAQALELIIPRARFEQFTRGTGVDLARVPSALVAGFDFATLYAIELTASGDTIEQRFFDRLVSEPLVARPHPRLTRTTGIIGVKPQTMVHVQGELIAVAAGDPTPARVVEAFARGKLRKSPSALQGSALRTLPLFEIEPRPVRFYAPGPFEGEWASGARGLLTRALAVAISATPDPARPGQITARFDVAGDFEQVLPDPRTQLLGAWEDLAQSSLGKLLGLSEPVSEPVLTVSPDLLSLEVTLQLDRIARGLHAAVAADVWEMMDLPPPRR